MRSLSLLIKPASSLCNLRCQYCFYHDVSEHREIPSYGMMQPDLLENIVRQAFIESDGPVTFAFQGGEPTLTGLDFYENLISLVSRYNTKRLPVHYALQTNGQVIDDQWSRFLARNHFLVGLSLDGDKATHDALRTDAQGKGSYSKVMQTVASFRKHQVEFNILTVVNSNVARHIEKIYRFYRRQKFDFVQFIPCLTPIGTDPADIHFSLTAERYAQFLIKLFDLWYADLMNGHYTSIRHFDNWVRMMAGQRPELCGMTGECTCQLVIEADGSVYPCDFYVTDNWRLGFVTQQSFAELTGSEKALEFIQHSHQLDPACSECQWYPLCRGGCRRDRELFPPESGLGQNQFCQAYREFFPHVVERLQILARQFQQQMGQGQS